MQIAYYQELLLVRHILKMRELHLFVEHYSENLSPKELSEMGVVE